MNNSKHHVLTEQEVKRTNFKWGLVAAAFFFVLILFIHFIIVPNTRPEDSFFKVFSIYFVEIISYITLAVLLFRNPNQKSVSILGWSLTPPYLEELNTKKLKAMEQMLKNIPRGEADELKLTLSRAVNDGNTLRERDYRVVDSAWETWKSKDKNQQEKSKKEEALKSISTMTGEDNALEIKGN